MKTAGFWKVMVLCFIFMTMVSCAGLYGPSQEDDREAITRLLMDRYLKGWNEGDADMIANTFAKDATFDSKMRGLLKGREQIRSYIDVVLGYLAGRRVALDITKIEFPGKDTAKAYVDIATGSRKVSKVLDLKRFEEGWLITHY